MEPPQTPPLPLYDTLPEGLIDVPSARTKYGVPTPTLRAWIRKGRVTAVGRLKAPAPGGGFLVVNEEDLLAYMNGPRNRGGRPRSK